MPGDMNRRAFVGSALAAAAAAALPSAGGAAQAPAPASSPQPRRFRLRYAPHPGMFAARAAESRTAPYLARFMAEEHRVARRAG